MFHYLGSVLKEPGQRAIHCANVMDSNTSADGKYYSRLTLLFGARASVLSSLTPSDLTGTLLNLHHSDETILRNIKLTTAQRCCSETKKKNILEDIFSSVLSHFKEYQPSLNVKFNNVGIFESLKLRNLMGKILRISL